MTVAELREYLENIPGDAICSIDNSHEGCLSFEMDAYQLVLTDDEEHLMFTQHGEIRKIY